MTALAAGASHHFGVRFGSVPWALVTFVLVGFVVYRAWRGSRRQVAAAIASAVSQATAEATARVEAELRASAAAQSNVSVQVGSPDPVQMRELLLRWAASLSPRERAELVGSLYRRTEPSAVDGRVPQ